MPSIFEKIQAKIELFRLEQRYTRNRHRRSAFISNAIYVDGEYIYQTPNNTGSSTNSSSTAASSPMEENSRRRSVAIEEPSRHFTEPTPQQKKRLNRFSSMPGFGSSTKSNTSRDWRTSTIDVNEVR
ncbi:uncharacterized protein GGS22DRAFT_186775 [Annulohypoxylon maeteangense]|uniref:uncharacterized protein n=1 Tax=Annulohypoxylon maeteangense TaxID=1927788 RepID=UPI00200842DD|nr:uncharacterized protein GGS22DRAFT_186775 [Annulohypoxylon maeteangense]KAI0886701.1 hypothetical protein GGS22DRAFT_186775 [Annulohypoxylon maeteangense]